jgi:hypothetical protein
MTPCPDCDAKAKPFKQPAPDDRLPVASTSPGRDAGWASEAALVEDPELKRRSRQCGVTVLPGVRKLDASNERGALHNMRIETDKPPRQEDSG